MITRNSYGFIHVGLMLRYVAGLESGTKISIVLDGLQALKETIEDSNFPVSLVACKSLIEVINNELIDLPHSSEIGHHKHLVLSTNISSLENTIYAESTTKLVYLIPERKYNGEYLLSEPQKLLSKHSFEKLSDIGKFDFNSACKCLLYGQGTAFAFHILRATEDTLKQYYFKHIKTKRLKKPMWGPMTDQLKRKKTNKPNGTLIASLDMVRVSYRNPTQHPEAKYSIDEAESLFGVCIDVLNKMTLEL